MPDRRHRDDPSYAGPERRLERITAAQVTELRGAVADLTGRITSLTDQVTLVGDLQRRQQDIDARSATAESKAATALAKLADVEATVVSRQELSAAAAADRAERDQVRSRIAGTIAQVAVGTLIAALVFAALLVTAFARQSKDNARLSAQTRAFTATCTARNVALDVQRRLLASETALYAARPADPLATALANVTRQALGTLPPAQDCTP
jgi:hypothetical protein